jgi:hypothetical protein
MYCARCSFEHTKRTIGNPKENIVPAHTVLKFTSLEVFLQAIGVKSWNDICATIIVRPFVISAIVLGVQVQDIGQWYTQHHGQCYCRFFHSFGNAQKVVFLHNFIRVLDGTLVFVGPVCWQAVHVMVAIETIGAFKLVIRRFELPTGNGIEKEAAALENKEQQLE